MSEVGRIDHAAFDEVLPLIAAYQRFYEATPSDDRNAAFFRRFVDSDEEGALLGVRTEPEGPLVGFACLHWRLDTVLARKVVCLHDLFVAPAARKTGAGRALLEAAADVGRACGAAALVWSTAPGNVPAQALYDTTGASRSTWYDYELAL